MMKLIYLSFLMMLFSTASFADVIALTPAQINNMKITLSTAKSDDGMQSQRYSAEVILPADQMHMITAPQQGLIDALKVSVGQTVKKNQPLAHIVSTDLVSLQSDYLQTLTQKQLAEKAYKRDADLYQDGIIAKRRYLETKSQYQALSAEAQEKKQALVLSGMSTQAIATLASNRKLTNGLTMVAPIDGHVIEQMVSVGQRVDMAMPIYKIAKLDPLWLEINVPVEQVAKLKQGMSVRVPAQPVTGKIITILRSLDKQTQTVHVRAEVTRGAETLTLGQFVEVQIKTQMQTNQLSIPRSALVRNGQKAFVFKRVEQGFEVVPVQLISEQTRHAIIEGGLVAGDKIAVSGIAALKGSWLGVGDE